jgi:hypothetical protein
MKPPYGPRSVPFGVVALSVGVALSVSGALATDEFRPPSTRQTTEPADLNGVLERASNYVLRYFGVMANMTAEERYVQELLGFRSMSSAGPTLNPRQPQNAGGQRRDLRSDVVLVKVGPPLEWRVYRDVFEVNGRPVRDRADRLARLFLEPADEVRAQAERIAEESARFNLSHMGRVLNEPGLPLAFLQPSVRPRFEFSLDRRERDQEWVVRNTEKARPTLFWHNRTIPNPSAGRFWIDFRTGEVSQSEHVVAPENFKATFTTEFRPDDRFGISVPTRMREQLWTGVEANAARVQGAATYSHYRTFDVTTEELPNNK